MFKYIFVPIGLRVADSGTVSQAIYFYPIVIFYSGKRYKKDRDTSPSETDKVGGRVFAG